MADTTITATSIIADFGSYYMDNGQGEKDLLMRPFERFGTREALTLVPTNDTILRMGEVEVGELLQAYQDDFTPKGSVTFEPIEVALTQVKIDNAFNPTFLQNTWLGFLASNKVDRTQWPFIRWFIERYLLNQADQDIELKAIYNGVKAAPVAGTAGAAINAMNGIRKRINDRIGTGDVVPIPTGAFAADDADFCTQIEEWAAAFPEIYWELGLEVEMNRSNARKYARGRRKKYNTTYAQVSDLMAIEDTNMSVKGRASMAGSDKIWSSLPGNFVLGVKGFENAKAFEVEKVDRKVKIYTDWWIGVDFLVGWGLFTNDLDLV